MEGCILEESTGQNNLSNSNGFNISSFYHMAACKPQIFRIIVLIVAFKWTPQQIAKNWERLCTSPLSPFDYLSNCKLGIPFLLQDVDEASSSGHSRRLAYALFPPSMWFMIHHCLMPGWGWNYKLQSLIKNCARGKWVLMRECNRHRDLGTRACSQLSHHHLTRLTSSIQCLCTTWLSRWTLRYIPGSKNWIVVVCAGSKH